MSSPNLIAVDKLSRLIGRPDTPRLIDVCTKEDFAANPRLVPGSVRRSWNDVPSWAGQFVADGRPAIVICKKGRKLGQGVAALLRNEGVPADCLDGGIAAWQEANLPTVATDKLPTRDGRGRTIWVTRARPKVDRIACPWLIRRFIDPDAVFLFVTPAEVMDVAERFGATPFDIDRPDVLWSHRGELCTFDVMLEEFGLLSEPLARLAAIVRGADTAQLQLAPESAGLLAASLGLSRLHADDLAQLEAGMTLYDAFYRWCRDATEEAHDWPPQSPRRKA